MLIEVTEKKDETTKWMWCRECWDRQYFSTTDGKTWKCTNCHAVVEKEIRGE